MEVKTRVTYDVVISYMKNNLVPLLSPSIIITDYETALRDSLYFTTLILRHMDAGSIIIRFVKILIN